jgi:hypothetical protein
MENLGAAAQLEAREPRPLCGYGLPLTQSPSPAAVPFRMTFPPLPEDVQRLMETEPLVATMHRRHKELFENSLHRNANLLPQPRSVTSVDLDPPLGTHLVVPLTSGSTRDVVACPLEFEITAVEASNLRALHHRFVAEGRFVCTRT